MKKTFLFLLLIVFTLQVFAQNEGIIFNHELTFAEALSKAKNENKYVFIDCYTTWCGPCRKMATDIFPQKKVGDYYNQHFVNLKLDVEKPENKIVAEKYGVTAFPTYLFLDSGGTLVCKIIGFMKAPIFIEMAKAAMDKDNNFETISKKIKDGDRTIATVKRYFVKNPRFKESESLVVGCFKTLSDEEKFSEDAWDLFNLYIQDPKSEPFLFFLGNRAKYAEKFGRGVVDKRILYGLFLHAYDNDNASFDSLKNVDPVLFDKAQIIIAIVGASLRSNKDKEDQAGWANFISVASPYLDNQCDDFDYINDVTWKIYQSRNIIKDKKIIDKACNWAKKAYTLQPKSDAIMDTYAHFLFETGKKKEAIKLEEEALKKAEAAKSDDCIKTYSDELQKFKQ
jgi:thioredoxin-related protein